VGRRRIPARATRHARAALPAIGRPPTRVASLLRDSDGREGAGIHVGGGHAPDVGQGDARDTRLEAVWPIESEPIFLHRDEENRPSSPTCSYEADSSRLRYDLARSSSRGETFPAPHARHLLPAHAHRLVDGVQPGLKAYEVRGAVATGTERAITPSRRARAPRALWCRGGTRNRLRGHSSRPRARSSRGDPDADPGGPAIPWPASGPDGPRATRREARRGSEG